VSDKKILYALMVQSPRWGGDYQCALIEDTGEVLHEHICSSIGWGRKDLIDGLNRKHQPGNRFPDGYEVVEVFNWLDVPEVVREANEAWAAEEPELNV
jgi:hypothetical protein